MDLILKDLALTEFDTVYSHLQRNAAENCDYNVCNMLSWGIYYRLKYSIYKDTLVLFNPFYCYMLFPDPSHLTAEDIFQLYTHFTPQCRKLVIAPLPEKYVHSTPDLQKYFVIANDTDWNDYIYSAKNLAELHGKKLAKKKNLISQFIRLYPDYHFTEITVADYDELIAFTHYWGQTQNIDNEYLLAEFSAIDIVLKNFDLFPCQGLKLYASGKLVAFSIWSPQTTDMATVHFEKSDAMIKGAAQYINNKIAQDIAQKYSFINREQDMGDMGLRQAKHSYQPTRMLPFYKLYI